MVKKKRFTSERTDDYNFSDILDNGEWIGICHIDSADDFVKKFNELAEENEKFKKALKKFKEALKELKEIGDYQAKTIQELYDENEQLLNFKENVFNSIDKKIKRGEQAIEWGESTEADVGAIGFHIELLKQLKKELKND